MGKALTSGYRFEFLDVKNARLHLLFQDVALACVMNFCLYSIFMGLFCLKDLLLRVPIHEIAAICYIRDDGQHILAIKHGK